MSENTKNNINERVQVQSMHWTRSDVSQISCFYTNSPTRNKNNRIVKDDN